MASNMNISLTDKTNENIAFIMHHEDINSKSGAIKQALNFYRKWLEKEDAKTSAYMKKPKTESVQQPRLTKAEQDVEKGKNLCVLDFEGVVCDENGEPNPNGQYCKYDAYEGITKNKIIKSVDEINPLERLEGLLNSDVKYRNTDKREVEEFGKRKDVEFTIMSSAKE